MSNFKRLLVVFYSVIFFGISFCQQNNSVTWQKINISGFGSFEFPSTMEIQKGLFREYVNNGLKDLFAIDSSQITFQQYGLNEGNNESFKRFARIILKTRFGAKGDFKKLDFKNDEIFEKQLKELNSTQMLEQKQKLEMAGGKLVDWIPAKYEIINGFSCVHICYSRQLNNNPIVMVNEYLFYNNDRFHSLTMSYRVSETEYWKSDYEGVLKSVKINMIK